MKTRRYVRKSCQGLETITSRPCVISGERLLVNNITAKSEGALLSKGGQVRAPISLAPPELREGAEKKATGKSLLELRQKGWGRRTHLLGFLKTFPVIKKGRVN